MRKFICTFGCGQPLQGKYIEVHAENYYKAQEYMRETYGRNYAIIYTEEEWERNIENSQLLGYTLETKYKEVIV